MTHDEHDEQPREDAPAPPWDGPARTWDDTRPWDDDRGPDTAPEE